MSVGSKPITQLFGSTVAVLNYNVPSRVIDSLANRIFATPFVGYFGDFVFVDTDDIRDAALRLLVIFRELAGPHSEVGKSEFGDIATSL